MRLFGPNDMLKLAGGGVEAAQQAIALVPRLVAVLHQVEALLEQTAAVMTKVEQVVGRASAVVGSTERVAAKAAAVVDRTASLTDELTPLLERFRPTLERLEPMAARLADTTSRSEVDAMVRLVNVLPDIADKVQSDIMPVLDTLGTVAPDLRDLLDVSKDLNEMLGSLPGLGRVKRRIEERQESEDDHLADEAPAAAPDRQTPAGTA